MKITSRKGMKMTDSASRIQKKGFLWLVGLLAFPAFAKTAEISVKSEFDWLVPSTIKVTELAEKNGQKTEMTYKLVCDLSDDRNMRVRYEDFQLVSINGHPCSPELIEKYKPFAKIVEQQVYVVGNDGVLQDVEGIGELIKSMDQLADPATAGLASRAVEKPEAQKLLKTAIGETWRCWVEAWIVFPASENNPIEQPFTEQLIPNSNEVKGIRRYSNFGSVYGDKRTRHYQIETTIANSSLNTAVGKLLKDIDKSNGFNHNPELDSLPEFISTGTLEVITNIDNLRPKWAKRSKWIRPTKPIPGMKDAERKESHEYHFDWN